MDAMDMSDLLTLVLVLLGVLALLGVAIIGFVMWRYRIPPRGLIAMIGALVYLASPVDLLPEALLGPLGLLAAAGAAPAAGGVRRWASGPPRPHPPGGGRSPGG